MTPAPNESRALIYEPVEDPGAHLALSTLYSDVVRAQSMLPFKGGSPNSNRAERLDSSTLKPCRCRKRVQCSKRQRAESFTPGP